ncbi:MAG: hypothetical protein EAY66_10255 [Sphingobacteriales bacterium]|nr:MAG: hypothetical protein EAY66_10255 [Sphingobacteriales bacterium]
MLAPPPALPTYLPTYSKQAGMYALRFSFANIAVNNFRFYQISQSLLLLYPANFINTPHYKPIYTL